MRDYARSQRMRCLTQSLKFRECPTIEFAGVSRDWDCEQHLDPIHSDLNLAADLIDDVLDPADRNVIRNSSVTFTAANVWVGDERWRARCHARTLHHPG